ncbi:substrate-binding periplasmic protein [Leucobacter triazinivorans]|uniref:Amino acid ABC transporter substrate-binding protein n=1 Tax=Leucobacter triazinivorans TaxID=1784719 RepID=A0A4P6KCL4_9MICO|nr:ABC transporter substrate-binding protein [Leucobacter triazinivorans]QBE48007.1 amino acid ABC transporter substrate-binding protein [Leucobacter triazinivorans]
MTTTDTGAQKARTIRLACIDSEALPLFSKSTDGRTRGGYEPEAAALVAERLGADIEWVMVPWEEMIPAVRRGDADAVWCGQGMTEERAALVDFTHPYAVFNETLIVRADDPARSADELEGYRIGAIANSTNMKLAETFAGAELVSFGASDDVFGDMIAATRSGEIDGFVDDDVVMIPLGQEDPDFVEAFTVLTGNRWGIGVAPGNDALREEIDAALEAIIADGSLEQVWSRWMPLLPFPLQSED